MILEDAGLELLIVFVLVVIICFWLIYEYESLRKEKEQIEERINNEAKDEPTS
jgi:large-conductance mechanosensitive channel